METHPNRILIKYDDDHAKDIGCTQAGQQFFLTTPFIAAGKEPGCEFLARFLFDSEGNLEEATIDNLGPRDELRMEDAHQLYRQRIAELGKVVLKNILIKPFSVERFGTTFGLIPRPPEEENGPWWVELHPGNYMAFTAPWDGEYYT